MTNRHPKREFVINDTFKEIFDGGVRAMCHACQQYVAFTYQLLRSGNMQVCEYCYKKRIMTGGF